VGNEKAQKDAWVHGELILVGKIVAASGTDEHAVGAKIDSNGNLELHQLAINLKGEKILKLHGAGPSKEKQITWKWMESTGLLLEKFKGISEDEVKNVYLLGI